ncbi:hypothetical protein L9F63_015977, partial [Diploptera punctata]
MLLIHHFNIPKQTKKKGQGILNKLINKLPVELHIPGYQYCGPGTKVDKRLKRGDRGINPLDAACLIHDIKYSQSSNLDHRHTADLQLAKKAFERVRASDASIGLSALGALAGGSAQIAKVVKSAQADKHNLMESVRHNRTMESTAMGME